MKDPERPQILQVSPVAAIPGGEFQIRGKNMARTDRPRVMLGDSPAPVVVGSDEFVVARVPDGASGSELIVESGAIASRASSCGIGMLVADSLHPVASPVADSFGNLYTTFSGSRGQKTPVSVFKIDTNYDVKPLVSDVMNATGMAIDQEQVLYVSSRFDGIVYQITQKGTMSVYVEGMGVATGLAFDAEGNLYVGDRSGTIFKISKQRNIYVFCTLEPSIAAYHLAFGADGFLYVTGPTTSSFDSVYRINPAGEVAPFYRGLGRPQGLTFDAAGNLYVAASLAGRKGIVRIDPDAKPSLFLSGPNIVGVTFTPSRSMVVATNNALYRADVNVKGLQFA